MQKIELKHYTIDFAKRKGIEVKTQQELYNVLKSKHNIHVELYEKEEYGTFSCAITYVLNKTIKTNLLKDSNQNPFIWRKFKKALEFGLNEALLKINKKYE